MAFKAFCLIFSISQNSNGGANDAIFDEEDDIPWGQRLQKEKHKEPVSLSIVNLRLPECTYDCDFNYNICFVAYCRSSF